MLRDPLPIISPPSVFFFKSKKSLDELQMSSVRDNCRQPNEQLDKLSGTIEKAMKHALNVAEDIQSEVKLAITRLI